MSNDSISFLPFPCRRRACLIALPCPGSNFALAEDWSSVHALNFTLHYAQTIDTSMWHSLLSASIVTSTLPVSVHDVHAPFVETWGIFWSGSDVATPAIITIGSWVRMAITETCNSKFCGITDETSIQAWIYILFTESSMNIQYTSIQAWLYNLFIKFQCWVVAETRQPLQQRWAWYRISSKDYPLSIEEVQRIYTDCSPGHKVSVALMSCLS